MFETETIISCVCPPKDAETGTITPNFRIQGEGGALVRCTSSLLIHLLENVTDSDREKVLAMILSPVRKYAKRGKLPEWMASSEPSTP